MSWQQEHLSVCLRLLVYSTCIQTEWGSKVAFFKLWKLQRGWSLTCEGILVSLWRCDSLQVPSLLQLETVALCLAVLKYQLIQGVTHPPCLDFQGVFVPQGSKISSKCGIFLMFWRGCCSCSYSNQWKKRWFITQWKQTRNFKVLIKVSHRLGLAFNQI